MRPPRHFLTLFFALLLAGGLAASASADTADADANKLFVEAMQLMRKADNTYDTKESVRLLRGANQLLKKIVSSNPQSAIAVQLSTHQLIGDFDVSEFEARIRALSCERGNYVEEFLSEYGIASATGPLTEACFLYRMESLLDPPEQPINAARPDWLAVAVDYHLTGQAERARAIILPYLSLLRRAGVTGDIQDSYALLARALTLTGASDQAQQVTERIGDCTNRLATMLAELKIALSRNDDEAAKGLAEAIRDYAEANQCEWQKGIVVQAYSLTGQDKEARALFDKLAVPSANGSLDASAVPPELAIAASMGAETETAVSYAKALMEKEPMAVQAVIRHLSARGEYVAAHELIDGIKESGRKASALAALITAALARDDEKKVDAPVQELANLRLNAVQTPDQVLTLSALARVEKMRFKDDRWRATYQAAVNAAERADDKDHPALVQSLAATLAFIKTGKPVLD